jgi:hypothetical protein
MQALLIKLFQFKQTILEYTVCAAWGIGGLRLAIIWQYLPSPEDAVKAFVIGSISAGAGILIRWVYGKLNDYFKKI